MKKLILMLVFLTFVVMSASASATITRIEVCDYCTSSSDFKTAAVRGASGLPNADIYVINTVAEYVRRFDVSRQLLGNKGDYGPPVAIEVALESERQQKLVKLISYKKQISSFLDASKDIPKGVVESVYELPGASYKSRDVVQYYMANQTFAEAVGNYVALSAQIVGQFINLNLVVQLNFSDGSIGFFKLTGIDASGILTFEFSGGVDADGNSVKPNSVGIRGSYRFTRGGSAALNRFIQSLERQGFKVVRIGFGPDDFKGGGTGSITDVVCDTKTNECRLVKNGG